jgi:hypothetical protein
MFRMSFEFALAGRVAEIVGRASVMNVPGGVFGRDRHSAHRIHDLVNGGLFVSHLAYCSGFWSNFRLHARLQKK